METVHKIEVLIKALGTMVMEPQYQTDETIIGKKNYNGSLQKPILEGDARQVALTQIDKLIRKL